MNNKPHDFKPGDRVKINWGAATNVRDTGTISEVKDGCVGVMVDGYTYRNGDRHSFYSESIKLLSPLKESNKLSKLKPFKLEEALAGKPVVTRNGDQVIKIVHLPEVPDAAYKVVAIIAGRNTPTIHFEDGKIRRDLDGLDLFMAPVKKTVWVNVYYDTDSSGMRLLSGDTIDKQCFQYPTEEAAKKSGGGSAYIGTFPLEIEL